MKEKKATSTEDLHDPSTPDDIVSQMRLKGRLAARQNDQSSEPSLKTEGRTEWWLGWYDEMLHRFYDNCDPQQLENTRQKTRIGQG